MRPTVSSCYSEYLHPYFYLTKIKKQILSQFEDSLGVVKIFSKAQGTSDYNSRFKARFAKENNSLLL